MAEELVYGSKKRTLKQLKIVASNYGHYADFLGVQDLIARIEFLESKLVSPVFGDVDHGNGD